MRTKNLYMVLSIFVGICLTTRLQAQVTIGSGHKPAKGLLLQIKDTEPIDPMVNNVTATQGGLILPRIDLIETNSLEPFITNADLTANPEYKKEHVGLTVYNTNKCLHRQGNDNGLYVWNGDNWLALGKDDSVLAPTVREYKDQDDNPFLAGSFGTAGIWMSQNLRATSYDTTRDDPAETITAAPLTGPAFNPTLSNTAKFWVYPLSATATDPADDTYFNADTELGLLYTGAAALHGFNRAANAADGTGEQIRIQGICPSGWHIPTRKEWNDLIAEIGTTNTLEYSNDPNPGAGNSAATGITSRAMTFPCVKDGTWVGTGFRPRDGGFGAKYPGVLAAETGSSPSINFGTYTLLHTSSSSTNIHIWVKSYVTSRNYVNEGEQQKAGMRSVRCKKNTNVHD